MSPAQDSRQHCWRCRAQVTWAHLDGKLVALEQCAPGTGDVAIVQPLIPDPKASGLQAQRFGLATQWREHLKHCPESARPTRGKAEKAHTAGSFARGKRGRGRLCLVV
jgi:hypothetical protein